ncbi:hypothetical protein O9992_24105 [Vibrio lentus]|nr:hypothetical protein [Vibrio lentus]
MNLFPVYRHTNSGRTPPDNVQELLEYSYTLPTVWRNFVGLKPLRRQYTTGR